LFSFSVYGEISLIFNNQKEVCLCAQKAMFYLETLVLVGEFNFSSGWLTQFKQQYGVCKFDVKEE
jgi:hypothetical protein